MEIIYLKQLLRKVLLLPSLSHGEERFPAQLQRHVGGCPRSSTSGGTHGRYQVVYRVCHVEITLVCPSVRLFQCQQRSVFNVTYYFIQYITIRGKYDKCVD